jgi:hypothetical protein
MRIAEATRSYEAWLARHVVLLPADLSLKHYRMREEPFAFLRATYYRWAQTWPDVCADHARAPVVLSVGDLHVENFGTWRDVDGRLVWGINDFDDCSALPYTNDLVRLGVSACLAIDDGQLAMTHKAAAAAIIEGYLDCLKAGGQPFVLADSSTPLREMARKRLDTPELFWNKLGRYAPLRKPPPTEVTCAIRELLPDRRMKLRFVHRVAGLGSLGKQRFTLMGTWAGGLIAREAKALAPSACIWATGKSDHGEVRYAEILRRAVRCPDPLFVVRGRWLVRRLSPDCFRVELGDLPKRRDESELLYSMGWETANVHLGSAKARTVQKDLNRRRGKWLHQAARTMYEQLMKDWKEWKRS